MNFATFGFQNVPPAPGRAEEQTRGPAPGAQEGAQGTPREGAPPPGSGIFGMFPLLILIPLIIFLFWSNRSQQKKQEATISALKKGDRVVAQSGLVGRLVEIDQRYARVELAPGVKVQMLRSSLVGRDTEETSGKKTEEEKKS